MNSYFISHRGTIYSRKFNISLVILAVLTGTVMVVIGNNIALSLGMLNDYIQDAGVNYYSARTRRLVRLTGTPLQVYLKNAVSNDDWPLS